MIDYPVEEKDLLHRPASYVNGKNESIINGNCLSKADSSVPIHIPSKSFFWAFLEGPLKLHVSWFELHCCFSSLSIRSGCEGL